MNTRSTSYPHCSRPLDSTVEVSAVEMTEEQRQALLAQGVETGRAARTKEVLSLINKRRNSWRRYERSGKQLLALNELHGDVERTAALTADRSAEAGKRGEDEAISRAARALANCHMLGRRRLKAGSADAEWWQHVIRICEEAGVSSSRGVLRALTATPTPEPGKPDSKPRRRDCPRCVKSAGCLLRQGKCGPFWHCDACGYENDDEFPRD